jgi:hypothetical protein
MFFSSFAKSLLAMSLALLFCVGAAAQPVDLIETDSGGVPVLVQHLPDWEAVAARAAHVTTLPELSRAVGGGRGEPTLDVVSFAGGTEAVTADYGAAGRLVIVEFSTPQFAADADRAISARIAELRAAHQSVPTVYQRKGNYSVFVFGATDEAAAHALVDRVHYEKDVRWLGRDPHTNEKANRYWINMSASVLVNTIKAAGLAIVLCLGVGSIFGTLVFRRRRAQAALTARYSDAGGMMRLNLDDHARKLLGQGEE